MSDPSANIRKLDRVLDRIGGLMTARDLLDRITAGQFQAFVENDSIAVTQLQQYPRRRAVEILLAVGDLADMMPLHNKVVAFADAENASLIRAYGRKGWAPWMEAFGWRCLTKNYVYVKDM